MSAKQLDSKKSLVRTLIDRFRESNIYWVIWGDRDLKLTREESRQLRYGRADQRLRLTNEPIRGGTTVSPRNDQEPRLPPARGTTGKEQ